MLLTPLTAVVQGRIFLCNKQHDHNRAGISWKSWI